jgi:hypothetical protein
MRGGRLPIDWEQAAGAATVGGLVMAIGQWWTAQRESAKKKRDEHIAAIAVKVVEESEKFSAIAVRAAEQSKKFPLAGEQAILNAQFTADITKVTERVDDLNDFVRTELPEAIARRITENGVRLHDPSKD